MSDSETTVAELRELWAKFRDERDWKQFHKPKDLAMGLSVEASELLELFLWKKEEEIQQMLENPKSREKLGDELADVLGFCLLLADALEMDASKEVKRKLEKNAWKYPIEKSYGSAKKYDEL